MTRELHSGAEIDPHMFSFAFEKWVQYHAPSFAEMLWGGKRSKLELVCIRSPLIQARKPDFGIKPFTAGFSPVDLGMDISAFLVGRRIVPRRNNQNRETERRDGWTGEQARHSNFEVQRGDRFDDGCGGL